MAVIYHNPAYWNDIRNIPFIRDPQDPMTYEIMVNALAFAFTIPHDVADNILASPYNGKNGPMLYEALVDEQLSHGVKLRIQRAWDRIQLLKKAKREDLIAHVTDKVRHDANLTHEITYFIRDYVDSQQIDTSVEDAHARCLAMAYIFEEKYGRSVSYEETVNECKAKLEEIRLKKYSKVTAQIALYLAAKLKISTDMLQPIADVLVNTCIESEDTDALYYNVLRITLSVEFLRSLGIKNINTCLTALDLKTEIFED